MGKSPFKRLLFFQFCDKLFVIINFERRITMKRDRITEIAELLDKRGKLTLKQLEEYFPYVSQMTLRRDLFQLEEEGKVIR